MGLWLCSGAVGSFSLLHYASPGVVLCIDEVVISIRVVFVWLNGVS